MSTHQLKNLIMGQILQIEDENFLKSLKSILDTNMVKGSVMMLSDEQKREINIGLAELAEGEDKMITNEDVEKEVDEWLKEQV